MWQPFANGTIYVLIEIMSSLFDSHECHYITFDMLHCKGLKTNNFYCRIKTILNMLSSSVIPVDNFAKFYRHFTTLPIYYSSWGY